MGIRKAPTYTALTLAYLEENIYEIIGKNYCQNIKTEFIRSWKRYLDDCFIFLKSLWGNINNLYNLLQNLHPKMKSIMKHSVKELPFLDILIKNQNGQIITDFYHKPTDTQQYRCFKSHHLKNCIKSIPSTLACRICTIVTNKNSRQTRLEKLCITFHH